MKKRFVAFLLAAVMLCAVPVLARAEGNPVLEKLEGANLLDTILQHTERIAYKTDLFDAEGNIQSSYDYADRELVVSEDEDSVSITRDGLVFGFDNIQKRPFLSIFLDDTMDEYVSPSLTFIQSDWEVFQSCTSNHDGRMVIETYVDDEEWTAYFEELLMELGYEAPELLRCRYLYVVDETSFEIESLSVLADFADDTSRLVTEMLRVEEPQPYEIAQELMDALFAEDKRTVTIILDPDTADETELSAQVGKGCSVLVYPSEAHPDLYQDRACTQLYTSNGDFDSDLQLYSIRAELAP